MARTNAANNIKISDFMVPGTEYTVMSAENIEVAAGGTRLLVEFRATTCLRSHSIFCAFHPRLNFLTDQQVEDINRKTKTLRATYFGSTEAGDPIFLRYWE